MQFQKIPYRDTGYVSKIICDLFEGNKELRDFYGNSPTLGGLKKQLLKKQKSFSEYHRKILVSSLNEQYGPFLKKESLVFENIQSLSSEKTFTITTGHQLNLMTGPVYFLYKIISVLNLCKKLKETHSDYNFVPVFWMATEDHDFEEISYFNFNNKNFKWSREKAGAVGKFSLEGLDTLFTLFEKELGNSETANQIKKLIKKSYSNSATLVEATRRLVHSLFEKEGLVIIDGDNSALKELFVPIMEKELLSRSCLLHVGDTIDKIQQEYDSSYAPQVNPREINLFYLTDEDRLRIVRTSKGFSNSENTMNWSTEELLEELKSFPERFSPNVLMRPLYQETILPNLCYVGGGGELAYWVELKAYFESQNEIFPVLLHRNAAVLVPKKVAKKIDRLELSPKDLFLKRSSLINKKVRQISNINLDLQGFKLALEDQFKDLEGLVNQTDATFEGALKAQKSKQFKGIDKLEQRLLKAQKRKLADQVSRLTLLHESLFPNQSLQERTVNFSEFYLNHGADLIPFLIKHLDPLSLKFDWIVLD